MSGLKTQDNQQFALVSTTGARAVPLTTGQGIEPLADGHGRLFTIVSGMGPIPPGTPLIRYDNGGAFAGQTTANIAVVPRTLIRVFGFKTGANVEYVQLYDTAGGVPVGVPFAQFPCPQNGAFSLDFGFSGRPLANGLVVSLSTSATAFAAAGATMWINAELV